MALAKVQADSADDAMARALAVLQGTFGYKSFRSHQGDIVRTVIEGGDALVLMPTGGGKSLCYQVPALVREGTAIVVSPLIALMHDQVSALTELGVRSAFLNSTLGLDAQREIEARLTAGDLDLLYVAPERLVQERTLALLARSPIALFAIDEAHCVSQWGHDFRVEYRKLRILPDRFPDVPRIALTATADQRTREEIVAELRLEEAAQFVASFDRPNIRYIINEMEQVSARDRLWRFLVSEHPADAGIVYCLSRRAVDETAQWLTQKGRKALAYHAGLPPETRSSVQGRFLEQDGLIVVATVAFGMGIDKPDVRFVAHLSLPKSIEAYYQETGRAGRDGEAANAWMAYGLSDLVTQRQWLADSDADEAHKQVQRTRLDALIGLCEAVTCRRQILLGYFGETLGEPCGNCDNCLAPPATIDGTEAARKALSAVYRTDQRFGSGYVVDVLTGKVDDRIRRNGHDRLSVFGIGKELGATEWRGLFRQLVAGGYLASDGEGHGSLVLTEIARPLLRGETTLRMRAPTPGGKSERKETRRRERQGALAAVSPADRPLQEALRALRQRLAATAGVPPYVIYHDRTMRELVAVRPTSLAALAEVSGLGERKVARYGAEILAVIRQAGGRGE